MLQEQYCQVVKKPCLLGIPKIKSEWLHNGKNSISRKRKIGFSLRKGFSPFLIMAVLRFREILFRFVSTDLLLRIHKQRCLCQCVHVQHKAGKGGTCVFIYLNGFFQSMHRKNVTVKLTCRRTRPKVPFDARIA